MLRNGIIIWISISTLALSEPLINITPIVNDPIVQIKEIDCKIQTGSIRIIHPINLARIEETAELITNTFYTKLTATNPLEEVIKFRIKKLYSTLYGLKPHRTHRYKRWDSIGTAWKWIAGSPDAQDLAIINSTINEIIDQNNLQLRINNNINTRITQLTQAVNEIAGSLNKEKDRLNTLETITTMLNINVIIELLDNIQEAITLSKISITNNKILSTREINIIKTALQDQGVEINFPDEALQFVTPKIAVKNGDLLYILHVPQLENYTSNVIRIFPLIVDNQIIKSFPSHIIRHGSKLYTTDKPGDFVQKSSDIREFSDECIQQIIFGKQSRCISISKNDTTQQLVNENTIIVSNAKNHILETNCGPDDRAITGNFIIKFANCRINFNGQIFKSSETLVNTEFLPGAFHNTLIRWNRQNQPDIAEISNVAIANRQKLDHVYLRQNSLHFKVWTAFGGFSLSTIFCFIVIFILVKGINPCTKSHFRNLDSPRTEPRQLELKEGGVKIDPESLQSSSAPDLQKSASPECSHAPRGTPSAARPSSSYIPESPTRRNATLAELLGSLGTVRPL